MKFNHRMLAMWQINNNFSNNKCAKLLGISYKLLSEYKSGNIAPTVYTINKLAERMGICAFDLITPRPAVACDVKKLKLKSSVLVKWQKAKGWSKKNCAEYVGISYSSWWLYGKGGKTPDTLETFDLLSAKMEIDVADLFEQ